jgi:hypothetical protein
LQRIIRPARKRRAALRAIRLISAAKTPISTVEAIIASCFRDRATCPLSLHKKKQETGRSILRANSSRPIGPFRARLRPKEKK